MRRVLLLAALALAALPASSAVGAAKVPHPSQPPSDCYQEQHHNPHGTYGCPPTSEQPSQQYKLQARAATASVEMWDSIDVNAPPSFAQYVAGYTSGIWPSYFGLLKRFAGRHVVSINIDTSVHGNALDIEPGDASPSQAASWVLNDSGINWSGPGTNKPMLYANSSEMPEVIANLNANGIPRSSYYLWLAYWNYSPGLFSGYDCRQWSDSSYGNNDESTCASYVFGPPPNPYHYDRFSGSHFRNPSGQTERSVVEHYDGARKHPAKYKRWIKQLERWLLWFRNRVYWVATHPCHGQVVRGVCKHPTWGLDWRGWRWQQLNTRAHGRQIAK